MAAIHPWWGCMYFNVVKENGRPHLLGGEPVVRFPLMPVLLSPLPQPWMKCSVFGIAGIYNLER